MLKRSNLFVAAGILIIALGAGNAWRTYAVNHSPLDNADISQQQLDSNNNFIPLLEASPSSQTTDKPLAKTDDASGFLLTNGTAKFLAALNSAPSAPAVGMTPDRIVIPAINLDAPIKPVHFIHVVLDGTTYEQWVVPNYFAAGWQDTSALLGVPGNTVLNGHHNAFGKVFQNLINLNIGDMITVYSGDKAFEYKIAAKMLLPERYKSIELRLNNARWIMPSTDERLTLITCWPANSNTHRVVIVAFPVNNNSG